MVSEFKSGLFLEGPLQMIYSGVNFYKTNFGINWIDNGFNKLNFTMNYTKIDVLYAQKVLMDWPLPKIEKSFLDLLLESNFEKGERG